MQTSFLRKRGALVVFYMKTMSYLTIAIILCYYFASNSAFLDSIFGNSPSSDLTVEAQAVRIEENRKKFNYNHDGISWPDLIPFPQSNYPPVIPLLDVIKNWNPDHPDIPSHFKETIQHFNYSNLEERAMAERYREAEVPFKLYDIPEFTEAALKWTDSYLASQLSGNYNIHVEKSKTNHFMYWAMRGWRSLPNYKPPTEIVNDMDFTSWVKLAHDADNYKLSNDSTHYYFMSNALAGDRGKTFIAKDLPLFSTPKNNFFITNVRANKGIQCRFSMRGIISEAHYDSGKNMVAMLKGVKRYILNPPSACKGLAIISDVNHPSYRHSVVDWSDVSQATSAGFGKVPAIDTVVREGEVLYIPSYWIHYIVSLKYSAQCNSRSGSPPNGQGDADIEECMGASPTNLRQTKRKAKKESKHNLSP